ncbi:hypothetical protein P168DRAFT_85579 [Aspergillus campestris IBT 28561]|uniref:Uncharacterized protein n=1 Tax=Aspergillus campestris (strain IBT 28561) TaxID=1392248 RepID=A0A2I1DAV7_ASPC2|nr:uncharacterized protein P168DRAFT_85579 [Aspergillus campestris IBT 28561]PKY07000.1 hypothetical protein P168DRAFT_85579 [Aspergillus campestris IBT 28561]
MAVRPTLFSASLFANPCWPGGETGFRGYCVICWSVGLEGSRASDDELYVMIVSNMGSYYRRPSLSYKATTTVPYLGRCLYGRFPRGAPLANQSFTMEHARKSAPGIPENRLSFHPPPGLLCLGKITCLW